MLEKIRNHRKSLITSLVIVLSGSVLVGIFALLVHFFGWDWTGFTSFSITWTAKTPTGTTPVNVDEKLPAKTFWDWLQLLIVPVVLAAAALWFNAQQARTEREINTRRREQEQKLADDRRQQEQELAEDREQATILETYLDRMTELLLDKNLRSPQSDIEIRLVARTRTLTTLRRLNRDRRNILLNFLHDANLIGKTPAIIDFHQADLSGADLSGAYLNGANLSEARLSKANLSEARLSGVNLSKAILSKTNLHEANLHEANLSEANLHKADLSRANLYEADLHQADLSGANLRRANLNKANLRGATISLEQLAQAKSLKDATLPTAPSTPSPPEVAQ